MFHFSAYCEWWLDVHVLIHRNLESESCVQLNHSVAHIFRENFRLCQHFYRSNPSNVQVYKVLYWQRMNFIQNSSLLRECSGEWSLESFNLSAIPCPNCDSYRTLEYTDYIKYGLIIVLMTLAIFGNFSVLMAFLFTRTLRQTIDIYLANLAVAGLFFSMCCLPILLAKDVIKPRSTLSPILCKLDPLAQSKYTIHVVAKR